MSDSVSNTDTPVTTTDPSVDRSTAAQLRRAAFSFLVTGSALAGIVWLGHSSTGGVAEHAIDNLGSISLCVVITYLGVSTVDRSGLLGSIGKAISGKFGGSA